MVIEIDQKEYTAMARLSSNNSNYKAAQALVKTGKATIFDINCLTLKAGEKGYLASNREMIYPTYEGSSIDFSSLQPPQRPFLQSFETRNVGMSLEVEPTLSENDEVIDLRLYPEFVSSEPNSIWSHGEDAFGKYTIKTPLFSAYRVSIRTSLQNGEFSLTHTFTGKDNEGNSDPSKKLLFFVMAEVVPVDRKQR